MQPDGIISMSWLDDKLKSWGLLSRFTRDDVFNAETEDALRDVTKGREAVSEADAANEESTKKLRETMRVARARAATFGQFEDRIRQRTRTARGH